MSLAQDGQQRAMTVWAVSVAISFGAIGAAHFIACNTAMPAHAALWAISACCVCQGALVSASSRFSGLKLIGVPLFMGLGMAGACYLGVVAIQMNANIGYNMDIVVVSLLIAVVVVSMVRVWPTLLARHISNVWLRAIYGGMRSAFLWHLYGNARYDESFDVGNEHRATICTWTFRDSLIDVYRRSAHLSDSSKLSARRMAPDAAR